MFKTDPLFPKRQRLAELMNLALDASYRQGLDPREVQWVLNRRRDQKFKATDPEFKSLPESQLDYLISYYGDSAPRCVW